ncbi:MAG: replication factor C subunit 1 [Paramarteilia canceri]
MTEQDVYNFLKITSTKNLALEQKSPEKKQDFRSLSNNVNIDTDSQLWSKRFFPSSLKEIVGQSGDKSVASKLKYWLDKWVPGKGAENKLATLISGPPGVGKTCIVQCVLKYLDIESVLLDSCSKRSSKVLKSDYIESFKTSGFVSIAKYSTTPNTKPKRKCIVVEDVDGMSGRSDHGGIGELTKLCKNSSVPIILICNDRNNIKIRSLSQHCYDLRLYKPRFDQIKSIISKIMFQKGLKDVNTVKINEMISSTGSDIRMAINTLQMNGPLLMNTNYEMSSNKRSKDPNISIFDACRQLLIASESQNTKLPSLMRLFFTDYTFCPLFIFENYLAIKSSGSELKRKLKAIKSISNGDCIESTIRVTQDWRLINALAYTSTIIPSRSVLGRFETSSGWSPTGSLIKFPSWFGKNSTQDKNNRGLIQIAYHTMTKSISTSSTRLSNEVIPYLAKMIQIGNNDPEILETKLKPIFRELCMIKDDLDYVVSNGLILSDLKLSSSTKNKIFTNTNGSKKSKQSMVKLPFTTQFSKTSLRSKKTVKEPLLEEDISDEEDYSSDESL